MKRALEHFPLAILVPVWVFFFGLMFGTGGFFLYQDHLFATQGIHVEGRVTQKLMQPQRSRHGNITYVPVVVYSFPAGGATGEAARQVREETWYDLTVNGAIPVVYLASNPGENRIELPPEVGRIRQLETLTLGLGVISFLAGAWAVRFYSRRNKLYRRLKAQGARCWGSVTSLVEVRQPKGGIRTYLTLRFATENGETVDGRSGLLSRKQSFLWHEGDLIQVFYDPQKCGDFVIDPDGKPSSAPIR